MYLEHFGLREIPFSLTPDPRYLYMSERHREALAHLLYGAGQGSGFVQLTGEVGTGKTTICRCLLRQPPERIDVALILNPRLSPHELLATLCDELHVDYPGGLASDKFLIDALTRHLLETHAAGRRTVVIIDEAQNLDEAVLEQVRLLTNLETDTDKLLKILLIGQPELIELLARPSLRQLAQRITARYHLEPLSREETASYIRHRLAVAGCKTPLFTPSAVRTLHRAAQGVPRRINVLCDRALLGAFSQHHTRITATLARRAAREVQGLRSAGGGSRNTLPWLAATALLAGVGMATWAMWQPTRESGVVQTPMADAPPPQPAVATQPVVVIPTIATEGAPIAPPEPPEFGSDRNTAFTALLARWHIDWTPTAGDPCAFAQRQGLACLRQSGNLAALRGFDHPALLTLIGPDGQARYTVLTGLDASHVLVTQGGEELRIPHSALEDRWFGEFLILWRSPPFARQILAPGMHGSEVLWLRERLGLARQTALPASTAYDEALRQEVIAFQREHRLPADGVVGPRTFVYLNRAAPDDSGPRLSLSSAPEG